MSNLADHVDDSFDDAVAGGRPEPIPAGEYTLAMDSYEFKATKDGQGTMMNCVFKVLDGEYENRKIFNRYNVKNKSAVAQSIGWGELVAMCDAIGLTKDEFKNDTPSALFLPFLGKVKVTPARTVGATTYDPSNEISGYRAVDGAAAAPASKAPVTPATVAAPAVKPAPIGGAKKMVWNKTPATAPAAEAA